MAYRLSVRYVTVEPPSPNHNPLHHLQDKSTDSYRRRGSARRRKGLLNEALADYEAALAKAPHDLDLHRLKALTLHLQGDLANAAHAYQKLIELFHENSQPLLAQNVQTMLQDGLQPLPARGQS